MEKSISLLRGLLLFVATVMVTACGASYQARSMDVPQTTLVDPTVLKKGGDDQALYRYLNPEVKIGDYTKMIIDPVLIVKDAELDAKERENYQKLANNALVYLTQELGQDYQIVTTPEAGAMRIQFAIIDADTSKPVRNVLSSVSPIGIGMNLVKYGATGKQSGVGEISAEIKVTDAMTGMLIGAAIDKRVGGKNPKGIVDTWYNADQALQYWAKQVRYVMCGHRGGSNCVKP
ncbi:MAG: DUF3313 domain-containing protein [Deltaproteobacteria bacterium]|nr:DUF3313 domain-containing protein [Deltaproteobacteria bacterium]